MKKKIAIIVGAIFSFLVIACICLVVYYNSCLESVVTNKNDIKQIDFVVEQGSTTNQIIDSLYSKNLIKNKYAAYVFVKLNNDYVMQAGNYELNNGIDPKQVALDTRRILRL